MTRAGKVYLIGAGPGDPKLLTIRAAEALGECDAVLIDRLVNREVLCYARPDVEVIDVGKRIGHHCVPQAEIHRMLIDRASRGWVVGRLKGGDPFVFGRGGEEAEALCDAGVAWEVIPGVTSGVAAPAYAGIPVLHREYASSVAFLTGHASRARPASPGDADTLVVFMGTSHLAAIAKDLVGSGRAASTPVALIRRGTWTDQEVYTGTLRELAWLPRLDPISPVLAVIGRVASLASKLHWFGRRPQPLSACLGDRDAEAPSSPLADMGLGAEVADRRPGAPNGQRALVGTEDVDRRPGAPNGQRALVGTEDVDRRPGAPNGQRALVGTEDVDRRPGAPSGQRTLGADCVDRRHGAPPPDLRRSRDLR